MFDFRLTLPLQAVLGIAIFAAGCDDETVVMDEGAEGDTGEVPNDIPMELGPEPCDPLAVGEARDCETSDAGVGTQFCFRDYKLDEAWSECQPSYECLPGETRECFAGDVECQLDATGVPFYPDCPFTPLVLSFDAGPVELASNAASFDMDGIGMCLNTDWPAADNPWLALDLDRNGRIDGGHELFGSGFVLSSGRRAANGFAALATLDHNRDSVIDSLDPRFAELVIWRDVDGDKISAPDELSSLADASIERIELGYSVREHCDARQNCGKERSRFEFRAGGQLQVGEVVDVHLPCQ
jgi:hypothetical protein